MAILLAQRHLEESVFDRMPPMSLKALYLPQLLTYKLPSASKATTRTGLNTVAPHAAAKNPRQ